MSIELTEQQRRILDEVRGEPPRVIVPRTSDAYILVPAADYEAIRESLEEERRQKALRAVGRRNAIGRIGEAP
jgi:PHD/YefM family antitoxin component YafN of YafNO toxin-antitoxin module